MKKEKYLLFAPDIYKDKGYQWLCEDEDGRYSWSTRENAMPLSHSLAVKLQKMIATSTVIVCDE